MGVICCLTCFAIATRTYFRERALYNPNFIFALLFGASSFISIFNVAGVRVDNYFTYIIVLTGVLGFCLGGNVSKTSKRNRLFNTKQYSRNFNKGIYYFLLVVCCFSCIIWIQDPIRILAQGGNVGDIYRQRLATEFSGDTGLMYYTGMKAQIIQYICRPLVTCLIPVSVALFFNGFKKRYIIIAVAMELIYTISTGGRTQILIFAVYFIVNYLILYKGSLSTVVISKKKKRAIIGIVFVIVIGIIYVFVTRGSEIAYTVISYYGYPIAHMETRINSLITEYTYGMASLQGLVRPILSVLGFDDPYLLRVVTNHLTEIQKGIWLSPIVQYNAFVTPFFFFYSDFGIIGVAVLSFIFGLISDRLYRRAILSKDTGNIALFLLSFGSPICFAIVRFQYVMQDVVYGLILTAIIFTKTKFTFNHKKRGS